MKKIFGAKDERIEAAIYGFDDINTILMGD